MSSRDLPPSELKKPLRQNLKASEDLDDEKPVFNDMDRGWAWVVLLAAFLTYCLLGTALYAVGIIHSTLEERYGASVSVTSWAGALQNGLVSLAGPVSSAVSDRFSCRVAIVTGGVLYLLGYLLTAFVLNIELAILTVGVTTGLAGGVAYTANVVIIGYYFERRRNAALGVSVSGIGMGLFVIAPLMQFIRDEYGAFGFFVLLSAIYANMITFGMLCFPSKLELHSKHKRNISKKESKTSFLSSLVRRYIKVFTNKGIFFFCLSMLSFCASLAVLYLYFPNFIISKGFMPMQAAFFMSVSGVFNVFGRMISGIVANFNFVNDIVIYSVTMALVSVSTFVYPFIAIHYAGQLAYFILLGLFMGPCFVLTASVSLKFTPVENLAAAVGLEFMLGGVGALIGPVCAGILIDQGGSIEQVIIIAACLAMVGAICSGVTFCFRQSPPHKMEIQVQESPC